MFEKLKSFFVKVKLAYEEFAKSKVGIEVISAFHTFSAIFIGSIALAPAFNSLVGTDLPTIKQLSDIVPVIVDSIYRALWMTFLVQTGLIKFRSR